VFESIAAFINLDERILRRFTREKTGTVKVAAAKMFRDFLRTHWKDSKNREGLFKDGRSRL